MEILQENNNIVLKNVTDFDIEQTLECGQCFHFVRLDVDKKDYVLSAYQKMLHISQNGDEIILFNTSMEDYNTIWKNYFDLERDYENIKKTLSKVDINMKTSIEYGKGIRILNQDLWETIISFIISANNNIPRIKGIIERLSAKYGKKIEWNGKKYYTFPTPEELKEVSVEDYRKLGLGFRDIRLYETTKMILENKVDLQKLRENPDTKEVREQLLTLSGVGPKVADCILLFSDLKRFEVFPIDVWVRRVMNDLYIKEEDETKVSKVKIEKIANEKFGSLAGLAQQYLFYWRRMA